MYNKADYREQMNPYKTGDLQAKVNAKMGTKVPRFLQLFVKHKDKISRVT